MNENKNGVKNIVDKVVKAESNSAATIEKSKLDKFSDVATRIFHTPVLTPKEIAFPALGEFASAVVTGLEQYRTLYFVNVLKIDMVYVTLILTLIGIYDVLNNPLMGAAYDRTRTRWGKARPYIIFTAIPYFMSTVLLYSGAMFFGDTPGNDPKKIIFVFVSLFIQETFATIYGIPRGNLVSLQTPNPKDRINVGLVQNYFGFTGSQMVFLFFIPIMELNNKGYINFPMSTLFSIVALIAGTIGAVGNILMALNCKERILLQPKPAPITKTLFYIFKNKYALRNFLAEFSVSWWANGGYKWDVVTQQEIFGGTIPSFIAYLPNNIFNYLSVTFIPKFQKIFKNNNKKAVIWLRLWDLFCCAGMVAVGCPLIGNKWITVAVYAFFYGINGINNGPSNVFEAELGREINDYTEYVTGERPDGTIGILTGLITKVTSPLNALLTVQLFKWSGYDPTITMKPWSQGSKLVYQKVFFLFNGITLLPTFINIIPYFFYDLVGEKRERMYIELNERRALMASQNIDGNDEVSELAEMLAAEDSDK